jgi:hypothetical protein
MEASRMARLSSFLLGLALLSAACNATSVTPSIASPEPAPTASPSPSSEPPVSPIPSPAGSRPPAASGATDPANFTNTVDNPWFPLAPGTKYTYTGKAVETFTGTTATKVIAGVACVVVDDQVALGGVPAEKLLGYYAQDRAGSVWYFGEDMFELDANGHVVGNGDSWHAGVDKAPPALFMEASPTVGKTIAHNYTKNDFAVLSLTERVRVPYGTFTNALVTKEWSPLEPNVETHKFYVPGVGAVRDVAVKGPIEELVLVKVEHAQ